MQPINSLDIEGSECRYLLSGGADRSLSLFDLDTSPRRVDTAVHALCSGMNVHKFSISKVLWYPFDTGMFFTSSYDGTVKVWDTNSFETASCFDLGYCINNICVSKSVSTHTLIVVAGDEQDIRICD